MTTTEERHAILVHIFETVFSKSHLVETLEDQDINTPRQIVTQKGQDPWLAFHADGTLTQGEVSAIKVFIDWANWYVTIEGHAKRSWKYLPKTIEGWQQAFTEDTLDDYFEYEAEMQLVPQGVASVRGAGEHGNVKTEPNIKVESAGIKEEDDVSAITKDDDGFESAMGTIGKGSRPPIKVTLGDIREFKGDHVNWVPFQRSAVATMGLLRLSPLMKVKTAKDVALHLKERKSNFEYNQNCIDFYSILTQKLANGTATCIIEEHSSTQDGPLAWRDLKEHYDFCGDVDTRRVTLLEEMTGLQLDSRRGFHWYKSKFEDRMNEFIRTEPDPEIRKNILPDVMKKTLFLHGITDPDYQAVIDNVGGLSYKDTVGRLYKKALDLNKADKKGTYHEDSRKQMNTSTKRNRTRSPSPQPRKQDYHGDSSGSFPEDVWKMMSPENRKWIIEQRRNPSKTSYGKQYDGLQDDPKSSRGEAASDEPNIPRRSNSKRVSERASASKKKNENGAESLSEDTDSPGSIFRCEQGRSFDL